MVLHLICGWVVGWVIGCMEVKPGLKMWVQNDSFLEIEMFGFKNENKKTLPIQKRSLTNNKVAIVCHER
jgi:hypothetical protein